MKYLVGLLIVAVIGYQVAYYTSNESIEVTINDKERVTKSSGESITSVYMVYTDKGVFENTDEMLLGKFDSADVQNELEVGQTYLVEVIGWRIPFMSTFRNIVRVKVKR